MPHRKVRFVLPAALLSVTTAALGGCSDPEPDDGGQAAASAPAVAVREIDEHALLLDSADPAELALTVSQSVYARAETVVLADAGDEDARPGLAAAAVSVGAPALLARDDVPDGGLGDELERLGARVAVVVEPGTTSAGATADDADGTGDEGADENAAERVAAEAGVQVVRVAPDTGTGEHGYPALEDDDAAELADDLAAAGAPTDRTGDDEHGTLREVLAVVDPQPGQEAAIATLRAAGAVPAEVPDGDLGAPEAVATLDGAQALHVVGVGPAFGSPGDFAWRVAAAERAALLPTGTQHLLPARYVTTSADRWDDPATAVARAQTAAAQYEDPEGAQVVPTLAVTVTATDTSDAAGRQVAQEEVDALRPLVQAARGAGLYVLLDVAAAGPEPLVDQVRGLEPLLRAPGVGLAVHPEARVGDGVTSTSHEAPATEVQEVADHLAGLVANEGLPPAMLVVHQTRPESVPGREALRSSPQVEVVVAADRTGGTTTGEWVWDHVSADVPDGVHLGWSGPESPFPGVAGSVPADPDPVLVAAS